MAEPPPRLAAPDLTLAQAPPGSSARVVSLARLLTPKRLQLQALGLAPGRVVRVLQQHPVSIVLCGHTEIALEGDLAGSVLVELED